MYSHVGPFLIPAPFWFLSLPDALSLCSRDKPPKEVFLLLPALPEKPLPPRSPSTFSRPLLPKAKVSVDEPHNLVSYPSWSGRRPKLQSPRPSPFFPFHHGSFLHHPLLASLFLKRLLFTCGVSAPPSFIACWSISPRLATSSPLPNNNSPPAPVEHGLGPVRLRRS